ncbi:conjugal transfer protein TraO [Pseudozobellia sp. WGM2]|uniref:conjugal transfer protein TraO n=1 Tax=Pseudozobellia sp. WGM2 TaxID=2787625 RepID=UPI001ADF76A1|nr:conjugal transfer protein TraO [Pseudozobellia sp. WGM2]
MASSALGQMRGNLASSVGVSAGYVEDGYGIMGTFNFHPNRFQYFQISVLAAIAEDKGAQNIPYNIFTIQPGLYYRVFMAPRRKNFSVFLGGGGLFGYEVINNGSNELPNGALITGKSRFIYGVNLGAEMELGLSNDFSLLVKANEYYHVNSDVGNFYPYAGVGLRYFLF